MMDSVRRNILTTGAAAAATAAAFINGLARFALMFLFVFYFQGVQGNSPIVAGIKLAPLALGMLIASPLAGRYSDRHGSRGLAVAGMLITGAGPMHDGKDITLQLTFANAGTITIIALVTNPQNGGSSYFLN